MKITKKVDIYMKLSVLVDNNTLIDRYFLGEPALSFFIEEDDKRILFDTGYSDAFIRNAEKMRIDLRNLDWVALSHGHVDHTWGVRPVEEKDIRAVQTVADVFKEENVLSREVNVDRLVDKEIFTDK
jgi:metal-dependent hydrolase (beta-lactamase superfamily II)